MSDPTPGPQPGAHALPESPSLEWLRKEAKRRLAEMRKTDRSARLADAQLDLARRYGFPSWRALKAYIDSLTLDGQLQAAARDGDVETLGALLDEHPEKVEVRGGRYEWTLLHVAAQHGRVAVVDVLLKRGAAVDAREKGDNTTAMHWAAAAGHLDVVWRLIEAGADVVGHGDDHALEIIGWATCWEGCDDDAHRAVVALLISRGARHNIFSAIAMNLADEVRRLVAEDPANLEARQSHNENVQPALHFAVQKNRPEMVALLLELGADPSVRDGSGMPVTLRAAVPEVGRDVIAMLARHGMMDLFSALALGDEAAASRLLAEDPHILEPGGAGAGALHMLAKRGDARAVRWLLARGANPSALWAHWDADVTPLHLAAMQDQPEVVRVLLEAGADPTIRDSKHDSDALGWAEFLGRIEMVRMLREHVPKP